MKSWQDNVNFVLVEPEEGGNIGASARAMANMGFKNLCLINPKPFTDETYAFAHGAEDVLKKAFICSNLQEALQDTNFVIGTSRRKGKHRGLFVSPWDAAQHINKIASKNEVAILFGRESKGLLTRESNLCSIMIYIPSDKSQPSINLSHSVMIIAYELKRFALLKRITGYDIKRLLDSHPASVNRKQIQILMQRIESTLELLEYLPKGNNDKKNKILQNITSMFSRTGITFWEEKMLQGLCSQIQKKLGHL